MRRSSEKHYLRGPLLYQVSLGALLCLALFMSWAVWGVYAKHQEAKARKQLLAEEYATMTEREQALTEKLDHLQTQRGMEEEIRAKFQVARPGEEVIVLLGEDQKPTTTPKVRSVWEQVLEYVW